MKITYQGHAWFTLSADCGFTVCCDPFDASVGYAIPAAHADAVTVSHAHHDHNNVKAISGVITCCDEVKAYALPGATVTGYASWHDDQEGQKRGENRIYCIEMDGVRVVHLGDLGHMPSDELLERLMPVDVLLVPVGGFYTIDAETALAITKRLNPAYVVPMHYKTEASQRMPIDTQLPFLQGIGAVDAKPVASLIVCKDTLPETTQVVVLAHS